MKFIRRPCTNGKGAVRAFAFPGDQQQKSREVITTNRERF